MTDTETIEAALRLLASGKKIQWLSAQKAVFGGGLQENKDALDAYEGTMHNIETAERRLARLLAEQSIRVARVRGMLEDGSSSWSTKEILDVLNGVD